MDQFFIRVETRVRGAIGSFVWEKHIVEAASEAAARDLVFAKVQERGNETRGLWSVQWFGSDQERWDAVNPHPPVDWAG